MFNFSTIIEQYLHYMSAIFAQCLNNICEIFIFPDLWSKNFFYKMFLTFTNKSKTGFENRKLNYPNRKWNYFSYFLTFDQKTSFTKYFSFVPRVSKLIFKTGNGIFQTGNGIISPTSRPLIKKPLLQNVFHLFQRVQNQFSKQEMGLSKQKMELFLPFPGL